MSDRTLLQVEKDDIRARVDEALELLLAFDLGNYGVQLRVDVQRHPLNGVFAAVNEMIAAFGAEQEQGRVFREELESKLAMVEKQRLAIRELSTPVIELWDGVLCLPIVGVMDTSRSTEMTTALLDAIVAKKSRYTIIDITGIEVMDTRTVDHFIRMAKSVRLLGAECCLTGISPHIAQTVVHMGIDLTDVVTHRSLREALQHHVRGRR